jgi:serine/threonine-protein kinase HipA
MHLKNFSLIRHDDMIELSPMYDSLNTTIAFQAMGKPLEEIEELALPLRGKKQKLTRKDWIDYFGRDSLQLTTKVINDCLQTFAASVPEWHALITISFLSDPMKTLYSELLQRRCAVLQL